MIAATPPSHPTIPAGAWRRIRRAALGGVVTTIIALVLVGTLVLSPPMPPELPLATANNQPIARATTGKPGVYTKVDRLRTGYRRQAGRGDEAVRRRGLVETAGRGAGARRRHGKRPTSTESIVAGFYINWEDNSFASLKPQYESSTG